jgi:hypothetical protein
MHFRRISERSPLRRLWPSRPERASNAIELAGTIRKASCLHGATRPELLSAGAVVTSFIGSYRKSLREKVPSSRFDLSHTGIWGAMPFSPRPPSIGAAPQAESPTSRSGLRPTRSVRYIVFAAPTSASPFGSFDARSGRRPPHHSRRFGWTMVTTAVNGHSQVRRACNSEPVWGDGC